MTLSNTTKSTPKCQKVRKWRVHGCVRSINHWGLPLETKFWCFCIVPRQYSTICAVKIVAHSFHWCLVQRKKSTLKMFIFDFLKKVGESSTFKRCCVKCNYSLRRCMEIDFYHCKFSFFCDVIFRRQMELENWQNFLKNHVFPVLHVHKIDRMTLAL